jgi:hypothetical protein
MLRDFYLTYSVIEVFAAKILFIVTGKKSAQRSGNRKTPGSVLTPHATPPYAQICTIVLARVSKSFRKSPFLDFFDSLSIYLAS